MKTKFLFYVVMIVVLLAGCASPQAATQSPTEEPAATATEAPPSITDINIDGDPSDWKAYPVAIEDSVGDSAGNVDVKSIRTFTNDRFLYLLVEVEGGIGSYVQLDVDFNPGSDGWPDYMANAYPNNQDFVPHVAKIENQQFNHLENTTGEVAQGEAFELRFPLDLFGDSQITTLRVRVMDGECCEANWIAVDETEPTRIVHLNATDASPVAVVPESSPTPKPPPTTNIVIDGNVDDWQNYTVSISDPSGDQTPNGADFVEARYFTNDAFLYLMIKFAAPGEWDDIAVGLVFEGDQFGQLNLRPNKQISIGSFPNFTDIEIEIAITDTTLEAKAPLEKIPSRLKDIYGIRVFYHKKGDAPVDESGNDRLPLTAVQEFEPTPLPGFGVKAESVRVEFAAEDGQALVGYYYPSWKPNAPVVLLVHQYGLPQENWVNYGMVDWLQNWSPLGLARGLFPAMPVDQSFAVFTLDLRGFGESGPPIPKNVSDEEYNKYAVGWIQDVKAAMDYIKTLPNVDVSRIAIVGANNGADAAVVSCGDCLGVLALSAGNYVDEDFKATVEALDVQGKVVWCFSTENSAGADVATCGSVTGNQYNWINFPGDGRGMQLIREDKAPADIGQSILDFLVAVFGFSA